MKLTDDQIQKQAEAIFAKLTAHKNFKPTATKGEGFICNVDTANEEVQRLAGGKLDLQFIANVNVANAVIALLRARAPKRNTETAQTSKPIVTKNGTSTPTSTPVVTPKVEQPKAQQPKSKYPARELHGLELAQAANEKLQTKK